MIMPKEFCQQLSEIVIDESSTQLVSMKKIFKSLVRKT